MGKIEDNKDLILALFARCHWSANMIAEHLGVSRQGIVLALNSWGIDTSKAVAGWVEIVCTSCGRVYKVRRSVARRKRLLMENNFCGRDCSNKWHKEQLT